MGIDRIPMALSVAPSDAHKTSFHRNEQQGALRSVESQGDGFVIDPNDRTAVRLTIRLHRDHVAQFARDRFCAALLVDEHDCHSI